MNLVIEIGNTTSKFAIFEEQNLTEFDTLFLSSEYQTVILFNDIKNLDEYFKVSRIGRGKPISRKVKMDIWELVELYNRKKKSENYIDRAELFNLVTNHLKSLTTKPYKNATGRIQCRDITWSGGY